MENNKEEIKNMFEDKKLFEDKKIIFCLPGSQFSGTFLDCWTKITMSCILNGIRFVVSRAEDSNVYFVRSKCLGADVMRGTDQKPFGGNIDYDYMMWIDSDVFFTELHFYYLLGKAIKGNYDILAGVYKMTDNEHYAVVKDWDTEFFKEHGHFNFLTDEDLIEARKNEEILKVDYSGFGFMLIKRGVFESMKYPWFKPITHQIGDLEDFSAEDVSFCLRAKEAGFSVHISPNVTVGHIKPTII